MKSLGVRSIGGTPSGARGEGRGARIEADFDLFPRPSSLAPALFSPLAPRPSPLVFLTYSHIPSRPPSRPNPLSRYPPNPADASNRFVELIHTTPALIFGAMSRARLMLSVQTLAASPKGVLLASATDSSGVRNVIVTRTGPKISTCAIVDDGWTSVKSVGG